MVDLGIGGYEEPEEIGRGGHALVYRAWQPDFQRHVAIKVVTAELDARTIDRFQRECASIGRLSGHPNIVTVHAAGRTARGEPYIVMELLTRSLAEQLAGRRMPWSEALSVGIRIAGALSAAHGAGIVHRDVKPENILLSASGEVKLGDFGIARLEGFTETRPGVVTASILHAAPEVLEGQQPTFASDIYSLGSTLYHLLAGRPPFLPRPDESRRSLERRIATEAPPPLGADVPGALARIVDHALAKDPARRPASAIVLGDALRTVPDRASVPWQGAGAAATSDPTYDAPSRNATPSLHDLDTAEAVPTASSPPFVPRGPAPRRRLLVGAVAFAVVAAAVVFGLLASGGGSKDNASSSTTIAAATTAVPAASGTTEAPRGGSVGGGDTSATTTTTAVGGVRLGVDLKPTTSEPCRSPTVATGAAWQIDTVQLSGRTFQNSYFCNLFAGATGSLDFILGSSYRVLRTSLGFADRSSSTNHVVRYELIGDGTINLINPITLRFGQVEELNLDVNGITRLRIRITELSPAGGTESPSQPALGSPTLFRS